MKQDETEFLKSYDISKYERPSVTADSVTLTFGTKERTTYRRDPENILRLLLIRRGGHPYKGMWALPGGFLEPGETIEECVLRELDEETGAAPSALFPVGLYSTPGRDPRGWIISEAFVSVIRGDTKVSGGDDADDARWFDVSFLRGENGEYRLRLSSGDSDLCATLTENGKTLSSPEFDILDPGGLAFDHARIIADALTMLRRRVFEHGPVFEFLPEKFTLSELQNVYETLIGKSIRTSNFRRKITGLVEATDEMNLGAGHRPAKIFKKRSEEAEI